MLHVLLDLYGCSSQLLQNEGFLRQVLDQHEKLLFGNIAFYDRVLSLKKPFL